MNKFLLSFLCIFLSLSPFNLKANSSSPFEPFTGKIKKNKVRLRLQPTYDSQVLRDLKKNDLILVIDETEDFYVIHPLEDMHAYIFRTFVLDNVVEGQRVNVRLKPELDAPIVAQLNSGDTVNGTVDSNNPKWLEIKIPSHARFYIAKEYVENYGEASLRDRLQRKLQEGNQLLQTTEQMSQLEMEKPFEKIQLENIQTNYAHLIADFLEFPAISQKAQALQSHLSESYIEKKVAYLENKVKDNIVTSTLENKNKQLQAELQLQKSKIARLEKTTSKENAPVSSTTQATYKLPHHMTSWMPVEEQFFNAWAKQTGQHDPNLFYRDQKQSAFKIKGIIEPYNRLVKNKPGDYLLVNSASKLPLAYLYSTLINLQDYVGHEISLLVSPRPNHHYAFPAYFVLSFE